MILPHIISKFMEVGLLESLYHYMLVIIRIVLTERTLLGWLYLRFFLKDYERISDCCYSFAWLCTFGLVVTCESHRIWTKSDPLNKIYEICVAHQKWRH